MPGHLGRAISRFWRISHLSEKTLTVNETTSHTFADTITNGARRLSLTKGGVGTLTLSGTNSYTGATLIHNGSLSIAKDQNLGAAPASPAAGSLLFASGGTLATTASVVLNANRGISLNTAAGGALNVASGTTLTYDGVATGAGALTKSGAGTLVLGGANTYTGATTISAGTLADGAANALPTGTTVSLSGTLDLNGFNQQVAALTGAGTVTNTGAAGVAFTINNAAADNFAGLITNGAKPLSLTKIGGGTLTLSHANTYTGATTIVTNTLTLGAVNALPVGTTVSLSGFLDLKGFSQQVAAITGSGVLNNSGGAATFTINNAGADTFGGLNHHCHITDQERGRNTDADPQHQFLQRRDDHQRRHAGSRRSQCPAGGDHGEPLRHPGPKGL